MTHERWRADATRHTCGERWRSPSSDGDRRRRTRWSAPSSLPERPTQSWAKGTTRDTAKRTPKSSRCAAAGDRARGATLYVTLEPCAHTGKTPPCADAIIAAGVARVVVAIRDPNDVARGGADALRRRRDRGRRRRRARQRHASSTRPSFNAHASDRPWVTLKLALSADGAIADPTGASRWITGPESRAEVHHLRANADAIAVGIGTVLADDPRLTVRDAPAPRVPPRRVVFDSHCGRRSARSSFDGARRSDHDRHRGRDALDRRWRRRRCAPRVGDIVATHIARREALVALRDRCSRRSWSRRARGSPARSCGESLVDRLVIFQAPLVLGDGRSRRLRSHRRGSRRRCTASGRRASRFGDDLMTTSLRARGRAVFTGLIDDVGRTSSASRNGRGPRVPHRVSVRRSGRRREHRGERRVPHRARVRRRVVHGRRDRNDAGAHDDGRLARGTPGQPRAGAAHGRPTWRTFRARPRRRRRHGHRGAPGRRRPSR